MLLRDPRNIAGAPGTQAFLDAIQPAPQPVGPAIGAAPQPRPVSIPRRQPAPAQQLMPLQQAVMNQMMRQSPMAKLREQQQKQQGGMMGMLPGLDTPAGRGIAAAGARGLQLSGYQDVPVTTGQVLGEMAAAGMKAYDTERKSQQASELAAQQRQQDRELKMMEIEAIAGKRAFEKADKLRDEVNAQSKTYDEVSKAVEKVIISGSKSAEQATGADDLALLFGYMKLLDPGSVVRESEFRQAQTTSGIPDAILALRNQVLEGTKLTPTQRQRFVDSAQEFFGIYAKSQKSLETFYSERAASAGLDVADVVRTRLPVGSIGNPFAASSEDEANKRPKGSFVTLGGVLYIVE